MVMQMGHGLIAILAAIINQPKTSFGNPGFKRNPIGHRMDMTDNIIALMPYLTIINGDKRTNDIINWGLKSITHFWLYKLIHSNLVYFLK